MRVYVKLRLAVLEIFAVKWPNFRPKISDLGDLLGVPPQKWEKTCPEPICVITQNFTPIGATTDLHDCSTLTYGG